MAGSEFQELQVHCSKGRGEGEEFTGAGDVLLGPKRLVVGGSQDSPPQTLVTSMYIPFVSSFECSSEC